MLCVKESVRLYKTESNANHGIGAMRRHGWRIDERPKKVDLSKGKVAWEVRGVRGLSLLIKLYDAYVAARKIVEKVLAPVEMKKSA